MEEFLKWIVYLVTALLGWIVKTLWDAVDNLKQDVKTLEVKLPETYVSKSDMKEYFDRLKSQLDRIENLFYSYINDAFRSRTDKD